MSKATTLWLRASLHCFKLGFKMAPKWGSAFSHLKMFLRVQSLEEFPCPICSEIFIVSLLQIFQRSLLQNFPGSLSRSEIFTVRLLQNLPDSVVLEFFAVSHFSRFSKQHHSFDLWFLSVPSIFEPVITIPVYPNTTVLLLSEHY